MVMRMNRIINQGSNNVWYHVCRQVINQVYSQVRNEVSDQVSDQVSFQIRVQFNSIIINQVNRDLRW